MSTVDTRGGVGRSLPVSVTIGRVVLDAQQDRYGAWYGDRTLGLSVGWVAGLSHWCASMTFAGGQHAYADSPQLAADALTDRLRDLRASLDEVL